MSYTRFFTGLIERRDNATDFCWVITFPPLSLMAELIAAGTLTVCLKISSLQIYVSQLIRKTTKKKKKLKYQITMDRYKKTKFYYVKL